MPHLAAGPSCSSSRCTKKESCCERAVGSGHRTLSPPSAAAASRRPQLPQLPLCRATSHLPQSRGTAGPAAALPGPAAPPACGAAPQPGSPLTAPRTPSLLPGGLGAPCEALGEAQALLAVPGVPLGCLWRVDKDWLRAATQSECPGPRVDVLKVHAMLTWHAARRRVLQRPNWLHSLDTAQL